MSKLAINGGDPLINKAFDLQAVFGEKEKQAVLEVLESRVISGFIANAGKYFYGGERVKTLEERFKVYFETPFAVAMNSATSALHAAIVAVGIKKGDEVIVPAMSMSASASAILMAGGTPRFIDTHNGDEDGTAQTVSSFNLDETQLEQNINKNTKAILIVHLFGIPANMNKVMAIAKKYGLTVIEDCAQAPGTTYDGHKVGTIGDIGVFSFTQSKTVSAGEGGLAITKNEKYALRMQLVRNHAESMIESFPEAEYDTLLGYNYRMTELEAAVATVQFDQLNAFNIRKIELANLLTGHLKGKKGIKVLPDIKPYNNVLFLYPILYNAESLGVHRDIFTNAVRAEGVPVSNGYTKPLVNLPIFQKFKDPNIKYNVDTLFDTNLIVTKICHHHNVTEKDIELAGQAISKVIDNIEDLNN